MNDGKRFCVETFHKMNKNINNHEIYARITNINAQTFTQTTTFTKKNLMKMTKNEMKREKRIQTNM